MKKLATTITASCLLLSSYASAGWHADTITGVSTYANSGITITVNNTHECGSKLLSVQTAREWLEDRLAENYEEHRPKFSRKQRVDWDLVDFEARKEGITRMHSALLNYESENKTVNFAIQYCEGTTGIIDRVRGY